jgi:predicted nucleic acid-binding protein
MILYLDSSAIVKQYVAEFGSRETHDAVIQSEINGTSVISRAEVTAAFGKAIRTGVLTEPDALTLRRAFDRGWRNLVRTRVTEKLMQYAADLAWVFGLRGYDSVHLASATAWQQAIARSVTLVTFDRSLWVAAGKLGLERFPANLPELLQKRRVSRV